MAKIKSNQLETNISIFQAGLLSGAHLESPWLSC